MARSSGSIGANYIEANENLGVKDLAMHLKISRKEAKESKYWLTLLQDLNPQLHSISSVLISECEELRLIFSSIINKL
ncbi:four helix bundle protein [Flavobacterium sp.]|uniref:four helix bundle protein n=1 Tax=Flavobacterium sp. TaxID=239 RepID=UPI003457B59A